jgi:DNA primase
MPKAVLTMSDIAEVLTRLHITVDHETAGELWALCPGHMKIMGREQSHPTWSINEETGIHSCFSCGYAGNLIGLVAHVLQMETKWGTPALERAKKWLENAIEIDLTHLKERAEAIDSYIKVEPTIPMTEARLQVFQDPPLDMLATRGLRAEAARDLTIRWDPKVDGWILPIRDADSFKLLGWQVKAPDWVRNYPTGIKKGKTLFGLELADESPVVVESPLDVVRLHGLGVSAVATFGSKWTDDQFNLLRRFRSVTLAFDNDDAGNKATASLSKKLAEAGVVTKMLLWDLFAQEGKDLGEFESDDDVLSICDQALTPQAASMSRLLARIM